MFFSGDPTSRKRVDMGGRSSKERDRQVLLEQTREERRRRLALRLQNSSATKIQVCFERRPGGSVTRDRDFSRCGHGVAALP
jgi:ubiquitin-protein ligase E3 C